MKSGREALGRILSHVPDVDAIFCSSDLDTALKAKLNRRVTKVPAAAVSFVSQKAANAVRTHLAGLLGGDRLLGLYDLDRLDLSVASTLDAPVQTAVTSLLRELRDPSSAKAAGLAAKQLLEHGDPAKVPVSANHTNSASCV